MKHLIAAAAVSLLAGSIQGQTWSTNLNSGTGLKLGLSSNHPLLLHTNNSVRLRLDESGHMTVPDLAGTGNRLVKVDANGLFSAYGPGTAGQVIYADGEWGDLPAVLNHLGTSGSGTSLKVYSTAPFFGIGTSSPAHALDVTGDIRTTTSLKADNGLYFGAASQLQVGYTPPGGGSRGVLNFGSALDFADAAGLCGESPLTDNGASLFGFFGLVTLPSAANGTGPKLNLTAASTGASIFSKDGPLYINNCNENVNICTGTSGNVGIGMVANAGTRLILRGDNVTKAFSILDAGSNPGGDENFTAYGNGQTFVGPKLQQNTGAMLTVGQAGKSSLALSLTDNTSTSNAAFYNVYGNGQTFIGSNVQQNTGAMLTVGQSNKSALALSLTDNTTGTNKDYFNVYGNGYTEIKVHSPAGMPNDRVLAIKDVSNITSKDLFVVKKDGKIYAREVEISLLTTFPDYVFADDYPLAPIPEVAAFIRRNRRLPGFEAAATYEAKGINVADMVVKQQQQLEEQMLYIIQLEKRLQALEAKK